MSLHTSVEIHTALEVIRTGLEANVMETSEVFYRQVCLSSASSAKIPILEAVRGGKHFRALCAAIGGACAIAIEQSATVQSPSLILKAADDPRVSCLMTALELYQASALVHDDLLDDAETRRGHPSPHVYFASLHSKEELWGSASDFGRDGAVLTGDFLMSAADYALSNALTHCDSATAADLLRRFSLMTGEVAMGQWADTRVSYLPLDTFGGNDDSSQVEAALDVVRRKSARYSVMYPAVLGATAAGGAPALTSILEHVLEPAGIAFQLRDDALGAFGNPEMTGKPTASDISEGKRTVLLALALQRGTPATRQRISELYHRGDLSQDEIEEVRGILRDYGHRAHEALIADYVQESLHALGEASLPHDAKVLLTYLVNMVVSRSA